MKKMIFGALLLVMTMGESVAKAGDVFGRYFTGGTLRMDCVREGTAKKDSVWVERWIDRGGEWYGSRTQMLDPFDAGDYRVEMRDAETGEAIYTRGYGSLFREYADTQEGKDHVGRFEETLLMPMPRRAVKIALQKRGREGKMEDATVVEFIPGQTKIERREGMGSGLELEIHGRPAEKVDVVIVAQGYGDEEEEALKSDLGRMKEILFGKEPFSTHRGDFNVYGVRGDVGAEFNTFGIDRYLMTTHLHHLHDVIGQTPCDYIIIMVRSKEYGGGAIYNLYAVSSLHKMAEHVLPHEFGHSFGGLADEYVDEDLSYASLHLTEREPTEPNITNLTAFEQKWADMLPAGTPVPTPKDRTVGKGECGPIGVYEGAGYSSKGVYRPTMHCMMRDYAPFCPVCSRRLEEIFGLYTK